MYPLRAKYAPLPIGAAILAALQGGQDGKHPVNDPRPIQRRYRRGQVNLRNRHLTVEYARFLTVVHNRGRFLARTAEEAIDIDLRWLHADLMDKLHDLRGQGASVPDVDYPNPDPDRYGASQDLGRTLRSQGSPGIIYDSVRRPQGRCAAVFKPKTLNNARTAGHIGMHWNGRAISHWFEKSDPNIL